MTPWLVNKCWEIMIKEIKILKCGLLSYMGNEFIEISATLSLMQVCDYVAKFDGNLNFLHFFLLFFCLTLMKGIIKP